MDVFLIFFAVSIFHQKSILSPTKIIGKSYAGIRGLLYSDQCQTSIKIKIFRQIILAGGGSLVYKASIAYLFAMVEGYLPILLQNQGFCSSIGSLGSIWNFWGILAMFLAGRIGRTQRLGRTPRGDLGSDLWPDSLFFAFCTAKLNLLATRLLRVPV